MRDELEGDWPEIERELKEEGEELENEEEDSRGKTAKRRTRWSQRATWRTGWMTTMEKDLEVDSKEEECNKMRERE